MVFLSGNAIPGNLCKKDIDCFSRTNIKKALKVCFGIAKKTFLVFG
jgi:hypothetical protein